MPRSMPRFDLQLLEVARTAKGIATAGEISHLSAENAVRRAWTVAKLEALYELAYLRVFSAWETCLEAIFHRTLCGYASAAGRETLLISSYYPTIAAAEADVLRITGKTFLLWHNPQTIVSRCRGFISSASGCPAVMENAINSNFARLEQFSRTRHRIVHDQKDARSKFDAATVNLVGRTYPGSRPGKFLRDWDPSSPTQRRWLDTIASELAGLATQMV
jgi:hypothetical protein